MLNSTLKKKSWKTEKRKTRAEWREEFVRDSFVSTIVSTAKEEEREVVTCLEIHLCGLLSRIPSFKNNKVKGFNFVDARTMGYLQAITRALEDLKCYIPEGQLSIFGDAPVFVLAVVADKGRTFDTDNAFTTIRDLLEPAAKIVGHKEKKERGWGINLVDNDRQIEGFAVKGEFLGEPSDKTKIYIWRLDQVKDRALSFILDLLGGK